MDDTDSDKTTADDLFELSAHLYQQAAEDPYQIATADLRPILTDPTAPPGAHANAIRALTEIIQSGRTTGAEFVDTLETLLGRPSLDTAVVLECLYEIAQQGSEAVVDAYDTIIEATALDGNTATRHATSCCVELVDPYPEVVMDSVPLFGALLDVEDHRTRDNVLYVLSHLADEYPEAVLPAVQDVIDTIGSGDLTATKTSFLGRVSRHHPEATREAIPALSELTDTSDPMILANVFGIFGDIAKTYPEDVVDLLDTAFVYIGHTDETVRYNVCAFFEDIAKHDPEAVEFAIDSLIERLHDEDEGTRLKATFTLGEIRAESALDQLQNLARDDPSSEVRSLAHKAVHRIERTDPDR